MPLSQLSTPEILQILDSDEHYYGEFGKQFLSNSDIYSLLRDPAKFQSKSENSVAFMTGGYFHTLCLEPEKLDRFKIIDASSRHTKAYKEISDGEICLLQHEVDKIEVLKEAMYSNKLIKSLLNPADCEYEVPGTIELEGLRWKGKADVINHKERLVIDLKTTGDIQKFKYSANRYNYDSQAFIYSQMHGYDFLFVVVDKSTAQLGMYDCSSSFLERGANKVAKASMVFKDEFLNPEFDATQRIINEELT